ncbi:MAG: hypothetical protein ACI8UD_000705 [Planctomycetota bacterium]|jgi:hypothetical protein
MLLRSITVAALTTVVAAQSIQIHPRSVDDLLPTSTYAAMRFGGLDACREATGQLPLVQLVTTFIGEVPAEMRAEFLDSRMDMAVDHVRGLLKQQGLNPSDLRALMGQPMTMAIGRLSIEGMGPSVCLVIEEGNERQAINRCVRVGLNVLRRFAGDVQVEQIKIADASFYHATVKGTPIFAGSIAGNYCISNSRGYLKEIAAVAAGKQKGLTAMSNIAALRQQLPAPPLAAYTINARSLMDMFEPHLPYEAADMADALGLGRLDLIYGAMTASQSGGTDLTHVGIGGSESGLAKSLMAAPAELGFAKACSKNTVIFGAGSFDVPAVIDAFKRFTKLLPAEVQREMYREMSREMTRGFRQAGTSPAEVNELVRSFGNQIGFAITLEKGAIPKPELLVRLSVKNAEPIAGLLQRIEGLTSQEADVEWRSRKAGDIEVRFCNLTIEDQFQVSPCYALTADGLWIGSDVAGLVRALLRMDSPENNLTSTEDFQKLAKDSAGASGVMHIRSFRGVQIGWRTVETMFYPMIDAKRDELGFDSDALPSSDELAEALGTTTMVYRVDDNGVTMKSEGPMTVGAILAVFGAAADEVLSRATGKVF